MLGMRQGKHCCRVHSSSVHQPGSVLVIVAAVLLLMQLVVEVCRMPVLRTRQAWNAGEGQGEAQRKRCNQAAGELAVLNSAHSERHIFKTRCSLNTAQLHWLHRPLPAAPAVGIPSCVLLPPLCSPQTCQSRCRSGRTPRTCK